MAQQRRPIDVVTGLRNTRRSLGDGTLGGRSRIATPYSERELRRGMPPPAELDDAWVRGFWPRQGSRRLWVREKAPDKARVGYGDLWVDLSGLTGAEEELARYEPVAGSTSGSAALLADGRVLYVWSTGTSIRQGHAPDEDTFLGQNGSVTEDRVLFDTLTRSDGTSGHARCAVGWDGAGRLALHTWWWSQSGDETARGRLYLSSDEGASWSLQAEFETFAHGSTWSLYELEEAVAGPARRLDDGSLVMLATVHWSGRESFEETGPAYVALRSTDDGASWTETFRAADGTSAINVNYRVRTLGGHGAALYLSYHLAGGTDETYIYESTDNGQTWTLVNTIAYATFNDSAATVHVQPGEQSPDGWRVTTLGQGARIQRWIVQSMADPVSSWTLVDSHDWPYSGDNLDPLVQNIDGVAVLFVAPAVGANAIIGSGSAELNVLDENGEWAPVASLRASPHRHSLYALVDHLHELLDDIGNVDVGDKADGDFIAWDADQGLWRPTAGGGGGSGGNLTGAYDLEGDGSPVHTDAGLSTELNTGLGAWTAEQGVAGTVDLVGTVASPTYDLDTRGDALLCQTPSGAGDYVALRGDVIADGEELIVALSAAGVQQTGNNDYRIALAFSDSSTTYDSTYASYIYLDGSDVGNIVVYDNYRSSVIGTLEEVGPYGSRFYFRAVRVGDTPHYFFSTDGTVWAPAGSPPLAPTSIPYVWLVVGSASAWTRRLDTPDPIAAVHWIRHQTYAGLDPW